MLKAGLSTLLFTFDAQVSARNVMEAGVIAVRDDIQDLLLALSFSETMPDEIVWRIQKHLALGRAHVIEQLANPQVDGQHDGCLGAVGPIGTATPLLNPCLDTESKCGLDFALQRTQRFFGRRRRYCAELVVMAIGAGYEPGTFAPHSREDLSLHRGPCNFAADAGTSTVAV